MKREEFADLVLSYEEEIADYARRLTGSRWDADDLVQTTYERAFRSWSKLRSPAGARAWLFAICRRLHVDRLRATAARPELRVVTAGDRVAPKPVVSSETVERATAEQLEKALEQLAPDHREAVLLCDLWGFRYEEIGRIVDVPVGTVRSRVARGRRALLELLQNGNDDRPGARDSSVRSVRPGSPRTGGGPR